MGNAPLITGEGNKSCNEFPLTVESNCTLTIGEGLDPALAIIQAVFGATYLAAFVLSLLRFKQTRDVPENKRDSFHVKLYSLCSGACFFILVGLVDPLGVRGLYANGTVYFIVDEIVSVCLSDAAPQPRHGPS